MTKVLKSGDELTTFFTRRWKKLQLSSDLSDWILWLSLYFNVNSRVEISMINGENFTFSEEEIYKIFVRKRSNKIWRVELCGIILLGSERFLENDRIHSCEISYCPGIEIFVHKYCSRVVPRTEGCKSKSTKWFPHNIASPFVNINSTRWFVSICATNQISIRIIFVLL